MIGALIRAAGHPVMHENGQAALISAIERLRSGRDLGIFPEGSLSPREGGLCRVRTGTVRLALEAGVPVIPVGIALDPQRIRYVETTFGGMTETARYYLQGPYAITIGQALTFDGSLEDRPYVQRESARLMERIGALACASTRRLMLTAGVPVVA
jgi:1-acyl-sn-glycerol-3-phosphate acyltransferase